METLWVIFSIYFLVITLLVFWLVFRFNRSQFRETLFGFFITVFTLIASVIIYNSLRDTAFGKWVRSGWRGESNLMKISFLLAIFLVILPCWLFVYISLSFLKWRRKKCQRKKIKKKGNATARQRE